jgi:hypothetical protein
MIRGKAGILIPAFLFRIFEKWQILALWRGKTAFLSR